MDNKKLTLKQESFVLKFIECGNASESYRQSYDATRCQPQTVNRKAKELLDNGKVSARIDELQAIHAEKHGITIDSITTELEEARKLAKSQGQAGAMVSASMSKAKLHGIILDKKEVRITDVVKKDLSPDDLRQEIINRGLPVLDLED